MGAADKSVVVLGCGDIGPIHEPIAPYSTLVRSTLATGDIRFGQCERLYSDRGALQVTGLRHSRLKPHMISVFSDCGFNVVSVAGNHAMDWGEEALLDTIASLQERGIKTVGAGRNLEEARRPAIVERNGVRVAFLAYCSVVNEGYAARRDRAGIAPLRVHTYYQPMEYQPGMPPKVVTLLHEEDLAAMVHDIAEAKKTADVGRPVAALGHPFHTATDRRLSAGCCSSGFQGRSRRDPRTSRAHTEGDRRTRRESVFLQSEQLRFLDAGENAGTGRRLRAAQPRRYDGSRLSASVFRHRCKAQPDRESRSLA